MQKAAAKPGQGADTEQRYVLRGDGKLRLKQGASTLASFDLVSVPDRPPTIALRGEPKSNTRGALTLGYKVEDDYGIVSAEAQFAKPLISGRAVTGRSLVEAPKMPLALPSGAGGLGEGETTGDLSEHPWAGARVTMSLVARDEGGNEGLSDPYEMTLPQRTFVKPLARAIVEQRRNLILAPDDRRRVQLAIDTLMFAPEKFDLPSNIYLGCARFRSGCVSSKNDPDLLAVADLMWEMALRLEDGDLSQAERDLRAAQQQLREALDRGATPDELKRLMDQLRAALDKFVQELAEQQMRDQQNADRPQDPNQQTLTITPRDLQALLDRMEEMARNGNTADAQRMLDSLQRMMENLQSARRQNQQNQAQREMNRQLNELDKLTREQQQLRDETFRDRQRQSRRDQQRPQGQRNPNQQGQQGQQGQESDDDGDQSPEGQAQRQQNLKQRQEALRDRLEQLQKRMKQFGMKGEQGFDDADEAMQEAEQGSGRGRPARSGQGGRCAGTRARRLAQGRAVHGPADAAGRTGRRPGRSRPGRPERADA